MGELRFGSQGELIIPKSQLGLFQKADPAQIRTLNLVDDLLLCQQASGQRSRPLLYGDLRLFHVAELMALIASMRKDGILSLHVPHARKVTYFKEGQIVFASSNVEDDRLGEVLWRCGYLSLNQLSQVSDLVEPGKKKLGKILIDKGILTPRQLYEGICDQVLEVVYSMFHFTGGEFVFVEKKLHLKNTIRLDMSTRDVIREGVRRLQELSKLEEVVPDRDAVLVARPVKVEVPLEEREKHLLSLLDGKRTVGELIEMGHLGEFDSLKAIAKLLTVGQIDQLEPRQSKQHEEKALPRILQGYAKMLSKIHETLKAESPTTEKRLEDYPSNPSRKYQKVFRNVGLDQQGRLDVDTLYRNARQLDTKKYRELALGALRSLYDYAVFQAMDVLEDDVCQDLLDDLDNQRALLNE